MQNMHPLFLRFQTQSGLREHIIIIDIHSYKKKMQFVIQPGRLFHTEFHTLLFLLQSIVALLWYCEI